MDRFLLGVNPLSVVDHFSHERARNRQAQLTLDLRIKVLESALRSGAQGFNFSLGDHSVTEMLRAFNQSMNDSLVGLYPMFPDTQGALSSIAEGGISNVIREMLGKLSWSQKARMLVKGGKSLLSANPITLAQAYMDVEVANLLSIASPRGVLRSIFLNEIVTDLAVSFQSKEVLESHVMHVKDAYGLKAGFVTRNLPRFISLCQECGFRLSDIIVMTAINKIGFQMCPSREAYEKVLREIKNANVIGMSILAAGQLSVDEAIDYLNSLGSISAVVVGVSSPEHARQTFGKLSTELIFPSNSH